MPDPAAALLAIAGDMLDHMAHLTSDPRFKHARAILSGAPIGRRLIDDSQALLMAHSLVDAGLVKSRNAACIRAAKFYAPSNQVDSMRARLMRKLRSE